MHLTDFQRQTEELTRANKLLSALSQVAASIDAAAPPDGVMATLGNALKAHDIISFVALVDDEKEVFRIRYTSIQSKALKAAEKLTGITANGFEIPFRRLPFYKTLLASLVRLHTKQPLRDFSSLRSSK